MGSNSSKEAAASSSDEVRGARSRRAGVLQSACLGGSSGSSFDDEQVSGPHNKENDKLESQQCTDQLGTKSDLVKRKCRGKARVFRPSQAPSISASVDLGEQIEERVAHVDSATASSSTQTTVARSQNSLSRSRSCFNFIPENISIRLSRALSLGSSGADSVFSTRLPISNPEEGFPALGDANNLNQRNETRQVSNLPAAHGPTALPLTNLSSPSRYRDSSLGTLQVEPTTSDLSLHMQNDDIVSLEEVSGSNASRRAVPAVNRYSRRNHVETHNTETRRSDRGSGAQEPLEGSVRFSRTLSVGRLRDRVLCRTSFSDGLYGHVQEDRSVGEDRQGNGRRFWGSVTRTTSDGIADVPTTSASYHLHSPSTYTNSSQDLEVETPQPRETSNHALVEHRAAFLERRRRIRSQVRALQRLGSRFENLSGHDRSCILSGQHRTGHCMCRTNTRAANPDEDTNTRASISRIVMLAEALFEQSVVLSSRPSVSTIGSVPAPKEVVECMPVKIYSNPQKHQNEEAAQCYICLVEYEDGDCMRILPCHHDFHRTCIDKWLKEIHRVCPLCRGDVCRSDLSSAQKVS